MIGLTGTKITMEIGSAWKEWEVKPFVVRLNENGENEGVSDPVLVGQISHREIVLGGHALVALGDQ